MNFLVVDVEGFSVFSYFYVAFECSVVCVELKKVSGLLCGGWVVYGY